jgi:hypothetical protein
LDRRLVGLQAGLEAVEKRISLASAGNRFLGQQSRSINTIKTELARFLSDKE